jgi:hypothetical protein
MFFGIVIAGNTWEKKFLPALLAKPSDKSLDVDALKEEKVTSESSVDDDTISSSRECALFDDRRAERSICLTHLRNPVSERNDLHIAISRQKRFPQNGTGALVLAHCDLHVVVVSTHCL